MRIAALSLRTRHLDELKAFYGDKLGLSLLAESPQSVTFGVGATQLTFARSTGAGDPTYHFAFNIPSRTISEAKAWLSSRVPLLDQAGEDQFHSESWNADIIYFRDPAGNIGELIARHTLSDDMPGPFGAEHLLCVSEIGLPTPDVPELVHGLTDAFDLTGYGAGSDTFTPLGDERGLFIVVREGRAWFPTDIAAELHAVSVVIQGTSEASLSLAGLPYEIRQQYVSVT
jgi:catechol 2,3-dioxygenase-like lactoylglutathione lyase family enzyme